MTRAEQYRSLAFDVRGRAAREPNPLLRAEWDILAETYVRLAEQTENESAVPTYDPIWEMLERSRLH